jgi:hypothetical protein
LKRELFPRGKAIVQRQKDALKVAWILKPIAIFISCQ